MLLRRPTAGGGRLLRTRRQQQAACCPQRSRMIRTSALHVGQETDKDAIARALGYPYARPDSSFLWVTGPRGPPAGAAYTFSDAAWQPPSGWGGSLAPLLDLQVSPAAGSDAEQHTSRCVCGGGEARAVPGASHAHRVGVGEPPQTLTGDLLPSALRQQPERCARGTRRAAAVPRRAGG
jgi:hypothetical protein